MTYSWTFKNLQVATKQGSLNDVMVSVDYRIGYTADRSRWAYHYGSVDFAPADPSSFAEFTSITEEQMINFVEQTLGDQLGEIKASLQQQFAFPIVKRDLPWKATLDFNQA